MWNIKNKICLITGATSGIGLETAMVLAGMGANVAITYRNHAKAIATKELILKKTGKQIETFFCDFSSFESIRNFVNDFLLKHDSLHLLINNSGIYETKYRTGRDGIELNWTVNHLAPFLLTTLLLETIKKSSPARIINVASESHRGSFINFNDIELKNSFSGMKAYGQSKLANILFTKQLAKNLADTGVTVNCLHPGIVKTNIFKGMNRLAISLFKLIMISPAKGAETSVFLATSAEVEGVTGHYFKKKKIITPSANAQSMHTAEKLWQLSIKFVEHRKKNMEDDSSKTKYYSNGEITIVWKPCLCTHVGYCFTELSEVFDPMKRPWISPYGASTERIIKQVERCPTDALTYFYNNQPQKQKNMENKDKATQTQIEIIENGPAIVKGNITIIDKSGHESETKEVVAICRCGKSKNKPFCDGSHVTNPFE
ncbi:MAG TPA: SDR family NAD(P)-dependent oxidoreductase [Bacteroidales bacterium]|nr:SDR family NAD(P)-dependent oxidoreductase [Bacteroidales bacterium]